MLKVLAVTNGQGFCNFYRVRYPLETLERQGKIEFREVPQGNTKELLVTAAWADVIFFQYASPHWLLMDIQDHIVKHKMPKVIICDFDDDLFKINYDNPSYKNFGTEDVWYENQKTGKKTWLWKDKTKLSTNPDSEDFDIERNKKFQDEMAKAIIVSDVVTVSSRELLRSYSELNENTFLRKNMLQPIEMTGFNNNKKRGSAKVVIGWQGGSSHFADLKPIIPQLEKLQRIYGDKLKFRFFGARFDVMYKNLNHELIPWIRPDLYFDRFSQSLFDIGIIPLEDTHFNRCKSNIKWLEYSFYRIPTVAANVVPYKGSIKHGVSGLLYDTPEDMFKKLKELIDDPILRISLSKNAQSHVSKHYNVNNQAVDLYNIFEKALEAKKKSLNS